MRSTSEYLALFEERLRGLRYVKPGLEHLYEPVEYGISGGGKRIRPVLALMGCEACGGDVTGALNVACGLEMFHNFTLLHDDVMDNSDMRRGRETVHRRWDVNTAILSGDTMLTLATQLVCDVGDTVLREVLERFNRMAVEVYEGQQYDIDFEKRDDVTADEYIGMIVLKTGALLGASAAIGALAGGGSPQCVEALDEYGRCLGVAFQIQDDYLDVFGDAETFGKPIGGDILNDKKTFLLLEGLDSGGSDAEALREAMKLTGDTKIAAVRSLYERMGLVENCHRAVSHWNGKALRALERSGLDEENTAVFKALADRLTGRVK